MSPCGFELSYTTNQDQSEKHVRISFIKRQLLSLSLLCSEGRDRLKPVLLYVVNQKYSKIQLFFLDIHDHQFGTAGVFYKRQKRKKSNPTNLFTESE